MNEEKAYQKSLKAWNESYWAGKLLEHLARLEVEVVKLRIPWYKKIIMKLRSK